MQLAKVLGPASPVPFGRAVAATAGLVSWGVGGVATFVAGADAGAVALVVAGAAACGAALVVPVRRDEEVVRTQTWSRLRSAVDRQVAAAEATEDVATVEELRSLQHRLDAFARTGSVPSHPADDYADAVRGAVARLLPEAVLADAPTAAGGSPDGFVVSLGDRTARVLTRWRRDPTLTYAAEGLPAALKDVPERARLLLVLNTVGTLHAEHHVEAALGARGRVVSWRGTGDDWGLRTALRTLLEPPVSATGATAAKAAAGGTAGTAARRSTPARTERTERAERTEPTERPEERAAAGSR